MASSLACYPLTRSSMRTNLESSCASCINAIGLTQAVYNPHKQPVHIQCSSTPSLS